ncbi:MULTISPECIES: DUF1800 domain-containing protein [unclassified Caulobacter]|uniref:DUF1800 domain-containing protein n=1 Tax=unclassified Caulobacter TaxID=2648921 RepID=UPI0006F4AD25|nr:MULTISPECIES: DUF1800 domain-containing protein [unclassified Caulobacter]KQV58710.1 hypothetical protein ASC62_08020 [Caulobacter sp. Root342]KQV68781.1 hypothetical protein ASC70_08015 [Caulobacter sp. Root343]
MNSVIPPGLKFATIGLSLAVALPGFSVAASPFDTISMVDRITWGRTADAVATASRLGPDRWLSGQLRPASDGTLPPQVQVQIDAMRISREPMEQIAPSMDAQSRAAVKIEEPTARLAAQQAYGKGMQDLKQQATARSLLRDLYSPNQLQEQMTWFWFNHFNVQADKRDIRTMVADYEDKAIRANALGKFRDLLKAADLHPAMLRYLDNDQNAVGHINENYAREVLELHTMGVGSGYTQKDVEEMARVLTGVGVSLSPDAPKLKPEQQALYVRRGLMEFNPARHDFGEKMVLGRKIAGAGLSEFEETLDILSSQPATAKHVSTKLAVYFMDEAPPKLIDRMTATFLRSDGDIADVLEVLFKSTEFKASLGKKVKDPIHYAVSAVRLAYDGRPIANSAPLQGWINRMGQSLYGRDTPDGYPLEDTAWSGPGQLTAMFEVARLVGSSSAGLFKPDGAEDQPAFPQLQNSLFYSSTQARLSVQTRTALIQARTPAEWNTLFLSSPEFLHR